MNARICGINFEMPTHTGSKVENHKKWASGQEFGEMEI
jgi:hypothetical protein